MEKKKPLQLGYKIEGKRKNNAPKNLLRATIINEERAKHSSISISICMI
jgi:hypothetical protein